MYIYALMSQALPYQKNILIDLLQNYYKKSTINIARITAHIPLMMCIFWKQISLSKWDQD